MNRVIKFHGKRVDNGEWIYGDLMTYYNDYVICRKSITRLDQLEDIGFKL